MIKIVRYYFSCLIFTLFSVSELWSQQGIGILTPSKVAALEIRSSSKGLLIPRIELIGLDTLGPISGEAPSSDKTNSLLIYNIVTDSLENIYPGYYYWTKSDQKWQRLMTGNDLIEPWFIQGTTEKATDNQDSIYIMESVAIGKDQAIYNENRVMLDVAGAIRGGQPKPDEPIGINSVAIGEEVVASSKNAAAFGHSTEASDLYSFAAGRDTKASGVGAVALGRNSKAVGNYSLAVGRYTKSGLLETSIGSYNAITNSNKQEWKVTDPVFEIGIGDSVSDRKNAMTVLRNGKVGIGIDGQNDNAKPTETLDIGQGKVRIRELPNQAGMPYDSLVVSDPLGVLKTISPAAIQIEPWRNQGSTDRARLNTADIYQMGAVAIGKQKVLTVGNTFAKLDVAGAIRGGDMYANPSDSVGENSLAVGEKLTASGRNSMAFGYMSEATGDGSFAGGGTPGYTGGHATGENAFAFGRQTEAIGNYAVAFGYKAKASQNYTAAFGYQTESSNYQAFAVGYKNEASGNSAFAAGRDNEAFGKSTAVFGRYNKAGTGYEMTLGQYNAITSGSSSTGWNETDPLFQIGNGDSDTTRHNAVTVLKDGWVGIGYHQKSNGGNGTEKLRVDGYIRADSLIGTTATYPDYVFDNYFESDTLSTDYRFMPLADVAAFLKTHRHLPNIKSRASLQRLQNGHYEVNLSALTIQSLEKIEELYLYIIQQHSQIKILKNRLKRLNIAKKETELRLDSMEKRLQKIEAQGLD